MFRKFPLIGALLFALSAPTPAAAPSPRVLFKTTMGDIVIELYPDKAPETVANFLQYVKDGFYAGTVFHRVIDGFMIQGGGMSKDLYTGGSGRKETRAPISLESKNGLKNQTGWVAMARTSVPDSATAQFFINVNDNDSLNHPQPDGHGYAVFGKVVEGMQTVNAIKGVRTGSMGPMRDVPTEAVVIESATLL